MLGLGECGGDGSSVKSHNLFCLLRCMTGERRLQGWGVCMGGGVWGCVGEGGVSFPVVVWMCPLHLLVVFILLLLAVAIIAAVFVVVEVVVVVND